MNPTYTRPKILGFSLIELLVTLVLIGFILALVFPSYYFFTNQSADQVAELNAKQVVSMYQAAQAAGVDFDGMTIEQIILAINKGVQPQKGLLKGHMFRLDYVMPEPALVDKLTMRAGSLSIKSKEDQR